MNETEDSVPRKSALSGNLPVEIEQRLNAADRMLQFRSDTLTGLSANPPYLRPKWCYDEKGGRLFEAITRTPGYYLTQRESSIISRRATALAATTRAELVMELGSGSSKKTRTILSALTEVGSLCEFVPLDVDERMLRQSADTIAADYPGIRVYAILGDYEYHVNPIPMSKGPRLVLFLGSTIGNLRPLERLKFLGALGNSMSAGDMLLLGVDLIKSISRLRAAYNDTQGLNTAFARNALAVINRNLDGNFSLDAFRHYADWNPDQHQMEMYLEATVKQQIYVKDINLALSFDRGDRIQTEISAKFQRESIESELDMSGFQLNQWWPDADGDFALLVAEKQELLSNCAGPGWNACTGLGSPNGDELLERLTDGPVRSEY